MGFRHDQDGKQPQHRHKRHKAGTEAFHLFHTLGNHMGKHHNHGEFCHLCGLEFHAQVDPPVYLILCGSNGAAAEHDDNQQHQNCQAADGPGQLVEMVVVKGGNDQHQNHARHSKARLAHNEIIAAVIVIITVRIAGGKQHDKTDGQQHQDKHKQRHVDSGAK